MKKTPASPENYHHYNIKLKERSRELRKNQTKAEKILWAMIRRKSIYGFQFLRQRPVLEYVADFMCKELLLILEADGGIHETPKQRAYDKRRDKKLRAAGFTILRFSNLEIIYSPDSVYQDIKAWVKERMEMLKIKPSDSSFEEV